MFEILSMTLGAAALGLAFKWATSDMRIIESAAGGYDVEISKLAEAYWRQYSATYVPKSQWILLNRHQKSAVYKQREDLRDLFNRMPGTTQRQVMQLRPKRPR